MKRIPKVENQKRWVALARGRDDIRYYLRYIYCDGERLIATDGHRLHMLEGVKLKAGMRNAQMRLVGLEKCSLENFPKFDRVIPKGKGRPTTIANVLQCERKNHKWPGGRTDAILVGGVWVNERYLVEALAGFDKNEGIHITTGKISSPAKPVKLTQGPAIAVVMPMNI